ncbi:glycosyltransferase [Myxococcota bacterium]
MCKCNDPRTSRFLFVLWDGGGSVPPQLVVARRLVQRGHRVRMMAPRVLRHRVEATGCCFVPYVRAPEHDSRSREHDLLRDWEAWSSIGMLRLVRDRLAVKPALPFAQDVLAELEREVADVVATDYLLLGPLFAAEKAGVRSASLFHQVYTLPARGLPVPGDGRLPPDGVLSRASNWVLTAAYRWLFDRGLPELNRTRSCLGLGKISRVFDSIYCADRSLVLTSSAFDFPCDRLPANVRYVGPQLDDADPASRWVFPWPSVRSEPLVLVSLSTTFQNQTPVIERLLTALAPLPIRVLVTVGPSLRPEAFQAPGNAVIEQYVPHLSVLPQAQLVITHAGHGTVITALSCGVPLLCLPMGRDQHDNAVRVAARGAGIRASHTASPGVLRRATQQLLSNPKYKQAALHMAEQILREDPASLVTGELEELALRSTSSELARAALPGRERHHATQFAPTTATFSR